MAYATVDDVRDRMIGGMTEAQEAACEVLLEDVALLIDAYNAEAPESAKKVVSCRVVTRMFGDADTTIPIGATQGSMSAMGYSQSWTIGGGSSGEIYLGKTDKKLLGVSNAIGSHSPVEDIVCAGYL